MILAKDGLTDEEMIGVLEKVHLDYLALDDPVREKVIIYQAGKNSGWPLPGRC